MDPNGVQIKAAGRDAFGRTFNTTGTVRPTNVEYTRSTSTVQVPKIRKWEWPVQFEIGEQLLNVVFSGVKVASDGKALGIGAVAVKLEDKGRG